jgi:hypothetical protein
LKSRACSPGRFSGGARTGAILDRQGRFFAVVFRRSGTPPLALGKPRFGTGGGTAWIRVSTLSKSRQDGGFDAIASP